MLGLCSGSNPSDDKFLPFVLLSKRIPNGNDVTVSLQLKPQLLTLPFLLAGWLLCAFLYFLPAIPAIERPFDAGLVNSDIKHTVSLLTPFSQLSLSFHLISPLGYAESHDHGPSFIHSNSFTFVDLFERMTLGTRA